MAYSFPTLTYENAPVFAPYQNYKAGDTVRYNYGVYTYPPTNEWCAYTFNHDAQITDPGNLGSCAKKINPAQIPNPSRPLAEGVKANDLIFAADSGYEQRRIKGQPKRTFDLQYVALTLDQYRTIRDFYLTVTTVNSFTWTHPVEKIALLVRFDMDTFTGTNKGHGPAGPYYELQLKLIQVWD